MCFGIFKKCLDPEQSAGPGPKPHQPSSAATTSDGRPPPVNASNKPRADPGTYAATQSAIDCYLHGKKDDGEINGVGWWQVANSYSAIALHDNYTHSNRNLSTVRQQLDRCHHKRYRHFINEFNDDTLWFGNALMDLYDAGSHTDGWLLDNASRTWSHTSKYQLPDNKFFIEDGAADMGGAMLWTSKDGEDSANTITTSLFVELCARLALTVPATGKDPGRMGAHVYLRAAERGVAWILREVYRREEHIILDGINMKENDRNQWTFTYTTGQTIAALALFARALRQIPSFGKEGEAAEYMQTACLIAKASFRRGIWTNDEGVLIENRKGNKDPLKGDDGWAFPSVLVRSMGKLYRCLKDDGWSGQGAEFVETANGAKAFVETQFRSNRQKNCSDGGRGNQYGPWWEGPFEHPTAHSQMAVLDVMAAIHAVQD